MDELVDSRFTVPRPSGPSPFRDAQRRMARWLDGPAHATARRFAVDALGSVDPAILDERAGCLTRSLVGADGDLGADVARIVPVGVLAEALGFADPMRCALRQPAISTALLALSAPVPPDVDRLLDDQLRATGRSDPDDAANLVALLHQCYGATAALIEGVVPPVPSTVRCSPDGSRVDVPLDDAPYGIGPHACPARRHAEAIAAGVRRNSWEDSRPPVPRETSSEVEEGGEVGDVGGLEHGEVFTG